MAKDVCLPAQFAADSVESLYALQGPDRPWIYWLLLAAAASGLGALPLIEVDVAVHAPGVVRATTDRIELVAPMAGQIDRVLAREHERVTAGQVLLSFVEAELEERVTHNLALQAEHTAAADDLGELLRAAANRSEEAPELAPPLTTVWALELKQFQAQAKSHQLAETKAAEDLKRVSLLAGKGLATQQELDQARFESERLAADAQVWREQSRTRWAARLAEEELRVGELASEARQLDDQRRRHRVVAPAAGVLLGFVGHQPGGYVRAGQSLGAVSPDDPLVVETFVSPRDIGHVRSGQRVALQVHAFPHTQWGVVEGRVLAISADALDAGAGTAAFRVTVRPEQHALTLPNGVRGELIKGLSVDARFLAGRRTLFQLICEDADAWLNPAGPRSENSFRGNPAASKPPQS